jgi:hypothetical protein
MELLEDQNDADVRHELAEAGDADGASPSPRRMWAVSAAVLAVAGAAGWWMLARDAGSRPTVALAVPAASVDGARTALRSAGIPHEFRGGTLWVSEVDAQRAIEAATARPRANAVADTLADESVFASGESARARRTAATIRELEAAIGMQPGVERASVVLGEPTRTAGPGMPGGGSASVTVSMRAGAMTQDLVDAVAVLVAGACPGMRPESVAVIDAGAGRVRAVRDASARALADTAREREDRFAVLLRALLADLPGASVRVREASVGSVVATVELPRSLAVSRAELETSGDLDAYLGMERERVESRIAPFEGGDLACTAAVSVVLAPEPAGEFVAVVAPEAPYSAGTPAQQREQSAAERERSLPLGSAPAPGFPYAWAMVAAAGLAAFAWWTWHRPRAALAGVGAEDAGVPDFDLEPLPGAEASEAVMARPADAAVVVGAWVDGGDAERAARLVVALDASAAAAVLKALPVGQVQQVTSALGGIDSPSREELSDAVDGFLAELGPARSGGYRPGSRVP